MDLRFIYDLELQENEVLCFVRKDKSHGKVYRSLMKNFIKDYLGVSEFIRLSEYDQSTHIYLDLNRYAIGDYSNEDLDIFRNCIDISEIRSKERIFRGGLDYYTSYDLLISVTKFFIELFKEGRYKIVVTQAIDNYIGYVMVKIAQHYEIPVVGIVNFFYKEYLRITVNGEHNVLRDVEENEIEEIYTRMIHKERSAFEMDKSTIVKEVFRQFFNYKVKYFIHYLIQHRLLGRMEYDFIGTPYFAYPSKITNFFVGNYFIKELNSLDGLDKSKNVYVPIHFYPEATVEFWVDDYDVAPYYPSLYEQVLRLSNKGYNVILKEHPAFYLKRDVEVYKTLTSIKNVYLIHPFVSTYDVIELVDYVVVWTGTSGIEALMQNKKVVTVSENYYSNGNLESVERIEYSKKFTEKQKKEMLKRVLNNCLPIS